MNGSLVTLRQLREQPHTSFSAVRCYLLCPERYRFRYHTDTETSHRSIGLVLGRVVHKTLERFYLHLQHGDEEVPLELLQDTFCSSWAETLAFEPPVRCDDLGAEKDKGLELIRVFHNDAPRPHRVVAVELPFAVPLSPDENRVLIGSIDAAAEDEAGRTLVLEHKTTKRRWSQDQIVYDPQVSVYLHAARYLGLAPEPVARFQFLLKTRTPAFQAIEIHRTDQQIQEVLHLLREVLRCIDAGICYRLRGWQCKDCEYAHCCN
jgi:putative RecB family exonuclease